MNGFKILTEDNCSPIQGGSPLFGPKDKFPITLPTVQLDTSYEDCAAGWNFCETLQQAFNIAKICGKSGLNKPYHVIGAADTIKRNNKLRTSSLQVVAPVTEKKLFLQIKEPNNKENELFEWFDAKQKEESKDIIKTSLIDSLRIKNLNLNVVFRHKTDYDYYYYHYYHNYHNYYNYHSLEYNYYYHTHHNYDYYYYTYKGYYGYAYIVESLLDPNPAFRKALITAYQHQMRQLRFDAKNKQLIVFLKSDLP